MTLNHYSEIDPGIIDFALLDCLGTVVSSFQSSRDDFDTRFYRPDTTRAFAMQRVSEEILEVHQSTQNDVPNARDDSNILMLPNTEVPIPSEKISLIVPRGLQRFAVSGLILYPRQGFMGWHTNSNDQGFNHRLYCTYVQDENRSFFRYRDPETGEVTTSWDKAGWSFRLFRVGRALLWHCVYSEIERYSIGFAVEPRE